MRRACLIVRGAVAGTLLLGAGGCAQQGATGFVTPVTAVAPAAFSYERERPAIRIRDAERATVIVYQHGQTRPNVAEDCAQMYGELPPSIAAQQESPDTYVWFQCSAAGDDGERGSYIFKRVAEIEVVLDELSAAGVRPRNIFLAGHSAGGWSSLLAARQIPDKFNAIIAFAPECCGSREELHSFPLWRKKTRPAQVRQMLEAESLSALVFAYADDAHNRPQDLEFLTQQFPATVEIVGYDCGEGHVTHLADCRLGETTGLIRDFIAARQRDYRGTR